MTTNPILKTVLLACTGFALAAPSANAAVVVTDHGLAAPSLAAGNTGYTGAMTNRFGFDAGETHGQTFTLSAAGILGSIYIAYNGFNDNSGSLTITVDAGNNGGAPDLSETVSLDAANFSGANPGDGNTSPVYWMEWDLSSNNLALPAGQSSFLITMNSETDASWLFAPMYSTGNPYAAGGPLGVVGTSGAPGSDNGFAVTLIPEPSAGALLVVAMFGLAGRRRRH